MDTTASSFTLRKNAKRAAEAMIRNGTAPAVDYDINPSGNGRFEIVWKTVKAAPTSDEVETEIAEASADQPPAASPTEAAWQQDASVCAILANHLQPDVLQQGSSAQLFTQLQQLVSDQRYADWNNASSSSSSFSGSLSIPDEVDAAIGDSQTSNASSWGSRRSQFLSMNFQQ